MSCPPKATAKKHNPKNGNDKLQGECYNCGKSGHRGQDCWSPKKNGANAAKADGQGKGKGIGKGKSKGKDRYQRTEGHGRGKNTGNSDPREDTQHTLRKDLGDMNETARKQGILATEHDHQMAMAGKCVWCRGDHDSVRPSKVLPNYCGYPDRRPASPARTTKAKS